MAAAVIKYMASSFVKLEKFARVDFKIWQKKMHFMISSMSVEYVMTTPMPEDGGENPTVEQVRKKAKWDNDDYVCKGLILNGMSHSLFDIYQNVETSKEVWDTLEAKYMAKDASSKKFLVSNFPNYKMTDSRPVLEQYNQLLGILERFTQHKINMDESFQDSDKPKGNNVAGPSVVNTVEHNNSSRCWFKTYESLNDGSILHIRNESTALVYGRSCVDLRLNIVFDNIDSAFMSTSKLNDSILRHAGLGHVHFKRMQDMFKDRLILAIDMDTEKWAAVRLPDQKLKTLGEKGIECIFVGYAEHSKAFRFYVIETNDSVAINSIIESRDAIFKKQRFSSIPRLSQRTRDEVSDQHSYCFNVEDDPKTFDKAMESQDVALWKEAINDEIDSIIGNNTWVLTDLPPGCKWIFKRKLKTTFLNGELEEEVYMNQPLRFIMHGNENKVCKLIKSLYGLKHAPKQWHQKFNEVVLSNGYLLNQADKCVYRKFDASVKGFIICLYVDDMLIFDTDQVQVDLTKKFFVIRVLYEGHGRERCYPWYISNLGTLHWQAIQRVQKYLKKAIDYRLVYSSYPSVLEGYTNASWISNTEDNPSTSGWVFLLGGGAIYWASKKQTCITGSTMESEFVALAATGAFKYLKTYVYLPSGTQWVEGFNS
nr:zinc finger, CCHC-type [Tanacetum cinerariifolium]